LGRRLFAEVTFKLDYFHQEGLPGWLMPAERGFPLLSRTGVLGLHKYLPYRRWFRRELAGHVREVVTDPRISRMPWWNASALSAMVNDHVEGRQNYVREINAVLTFEAIDRLLIGAESTVPEEVVELL
jgi:asparagine synthase (glutamine-hydrolysing)